MTDRSPHWSFAEYALFRRLLGAYLLIHFAMLLPYGSELFSSEGMLGDRRLAPLLDVTPSVLRFFDGPWSVQLTIAAAVLASILLIAGRLDRASALVLWYALASLYARNPLIANPSLPVAGWLLLLHALLPKLRRDIASLASWSVPRAFFVAAWVVLAASYSYSGWTKLMSPSWVSGDAVRIVLENPLARDHALRSLLLTLPEWTFEALTFTILYVELLFAPLALLARLRPWLWAIMLAVQLGFLAVLDFADLTTPMLLLHLFTVERRWLACFESKVPATVYYDGNCALCHRIVRFALIEDRRRRLKFAPLQSDTAIAYLGDERYRGRIDTIVVRTADGETHERSDAAVEILYRLGGGWALLGALLARAPKALRDRGYDYVGANRARFGRAALLCPVVPPELADRFLRSADAPTAAPLLTDGSLDMLRGKDGRGPSSGET